METYQTLSIESFSYSWLANMNTSLKAQDAPREIHWMHMMKLIHSFMEMYAQLSSSKRLFKVSQDFYFPISEAPMGLVDADELILNGFIVPAFVNQVKADAYDACDDPAPSCASASNSSKKLHSVSDSANRTRGSSLKKCRKLSKQIFLRYLHFLKPLCQRVRERRSGSRVGTFTAILHGERNWDCSTSTSPRVRVANSCDNWRKLK